MSNIKRWQTVRSETTFSTPWFSVRKDACIIGDAQGNGEKTDESAPFYVIDTADWVCVVAITDAGDLVLVRQYRHGWGDITLELPAGEVHAGEDIITAARRELAEETGYLGGEVQLVASTSPNPARYSNQLHIVAIRGPAKLADLKNDPEEQTEPVTWPLTSVRDLLRDPTFVNSSQVGALAIALVGMDACDGSPR